MKQYKICSSVILEHKYGKEQQGHSSEQSYVHCLYCLPVCTHPLTMAKAVAFQTINNMSTFIEINECCNGMQAHFLRLLTKAQTTSLKKKRKKKRIDTVCSFYQAFHRMLTVKSF